MNLFNREIIAYSISDVQNTDFVLDTLNQLELPWSPTGMAKSYFDETRH